MQGWLKGQSHILKIAMMVIGPAARPSPAGPECKKNYMNLKGKWKYLFHNKVFFCFFFHICRCSTCEGVTRGQPRPIDLKSSFILSYLNSDMGQVSPGICQHVK